MKKILLLLFVTILLTSCFGEEDNKEQLENEIKNKVSFENPKNSLEEDINAREFNINADKDSQLDLAKSYLRYGDAYYNEEVFADKALEILNKMEEEFIVEYLKGYAYEIQTKYDKALFQYNKVLAYENITKDEKITAINQKGHIFDLQGDIEKANEYYVQAEDLDLENLKTLINRGRYEARVGNNDSAKIYFTKIISKTKNKNIISEMYYNLSTISQDDNNYNEAIDYANKGIENNKDYSNNYLSLGVSSLSKGGNDLDNVSKNLKKAIELYPNSSTAYKYLGIYYYTKDNFDKAIENFKKQVEVSNKDILLMADDKEEIKASGEYDLARAYAQKGDSKNTLIYLKKSFESDLVTYYGSFMIEYLAQDGPFIKVQDDKEIQKEFKNIILKYNK